jgi:hypothetical protein
MRRQYSISGLVHAQLFPNPTPQDPQDFSTHLIRNLITEVRIETQRFYGGLDTIEAKYPGLNYSHPPHRKRLSRFPHHNRLFKAFDEIGLTNYEISQLCKWEGTLWARQRYEKDEGITVRDTTGDEIRPWVRSKGRKRTGNSIKVKTDIEVEIVELGNSQVCHHNAHSAHPGNSPDGVLQQQMNLSGPVTTSSTQTDENIATPRAVDGGETDDDDIESVGIELNQRLIAAAAAREQQPNSDIIMDPAYEAYLKEAAEQGALRRGSVSMEFASLQEQQVQQ